MYGTDFVYEPQPVYNLRGGILDIYSFDERKPYRVELFVAMMWTASTVIRSRNYS